MQTLCDGWYDGTSAPSVIEKHREKIADKWGLLSIPFEAVIYWPGYPVDSEDFSALERYGRDWPILDYSPVAITELRKNRFLSLRLDLNHPLQDLLPLIEKELREADVGRARKRRRLDKVDQQLFVFDRVVEGATFPDIARKLRKRISTVKDMYLSAARKVFNSPNPPGKEQAFSERLLTDFDLKTHIRKCPTCKAATVIDQLCEAARCFVNQDKVAQREMTGRRSTRA